MRVHTHTTRRDLIRAVWLAASVAALGSVALPRLVATGPAALAQDVDADPTKTRAAELDELSELKTRVAEPVQCSPVSTETPAPATPMPSPVPPLATGVPISYADRFTITVLGIAPVPAGGGVETQGQLLRLNVTVLNTTASVLSPPFSSWLLTDASGQPYQLSSEASDAIEGGWGLPVQPGVIEDRAVVFDVLPNAGTAFTLESRDEPTFRVALAIESRG